MRVLECTSAPPPRALRRGRSRSVRVLVKGGLLTIMCGFFSAIARYGIHERVTERQGAVGDGWKRTRCDRIYLERGRDIKDECVRGQYQTFFCSQATAGAVVAVLHL